MGSCSSSRRSMNWRRHWTSDLPTGSCAHGRNHYRNNRSLSPDTNRWAEYCLLQNRSTDLLNRARSHQDTNSPNLVHHGPGCKTGYNTRCSSNSYREMCSCRARLCWDYPGANCFHRLAMGVLASPSLTTRRWLPTGCTLRMTGGAVSSRSPVSFSALISLGV